MAFRLRLKKSLKQDALRVGLEQFALLSQPVNSRTDSKHIHEMRKATKRLRAQLTLFNGCAKSAAIRKADRQLRDINRRLSGDRDRDVLAQTLAGLEARFDLGGASAKAAHVAIEQAGDNERRTRRSRDLAGEVADAQRSFCRLFHATIEPKQLIAAMAVDYADGRYLSKRLTIKGRAEDFHEWRKLVQRHWRHMLLLEGLWPKELASRARAAKKMSDVLGQDHDLAMFRDWLEKQRGSAVPDQECDSLGALAKVWQRELRRVALPLGARLFAERRRHLKLRFNGYLEANKAMPRKGKRILENDLLASAHVVHLPARV